MGVERFLHAQGGSWGGDSEAVRLSGQDWEQEFLGTEWAKWVWELAVCWGGQICRVGKKGQGRGGGRAPARSPETGELDERAASPCWLGLGWVCWPALTPAGDRTTGGATIRPSMDVRSERRADGGALRRD